MIKVYPNEVVFEDNRGQVLARASLKQFTKALAERTQRFSVGALTDGYCLRFIGAGQRSFLVERSPGPLKLASGRQLLLPWFYIYLNVEQPRSIDLFFTPQPVELLDDQIFPPWFPPSLIKGTHYLYGDAIKFSPAISTTIYTLQLDLAKRLGGVSDAEEIESSPLGATVWATLAKSWGKKLPTEDQFPASDKTLLDLVGKPVPPSTPSDSDLHKFLLSVFAECS